MAEIGRFVVFGLEGGRYALPLAAVQRVVRAVEVTALPGAPAVVLGMIDVEGDVIPVLSLRRRFRLSDRAVAPADQYLITRAGGRRVALVIDEAQAVLAVPDGEIIGQSEIGAGGDQVQGVIRLRDGLALIHNLQKLLSPDETVALDAAMDREEDYVI